ncbi:MAG: hypothetical protein R3C99_10040 [Pirellulaceae bacterium]
MLLATCVYISISTRSRRGLVALLETSPHTSARQRVRHAKQQGELSALKAAARGSVAGSRAAGLLKSHIGFVRLRIYEPRVPCGEGMLAGFSLGNYLLLLDYSSRLVRQGKARVSPEVAGIFDGLGSSPEIWNHRLRTMLDKSRLLGGISITTATACERSRLNAASITLDNAADRQ